MFHYKYINNEIYIIITDVIKIKTSVRYRDNDWIISYREMDDDFYALQQLCVCVCVCVPRIDEIFLDTRITHLRVCSITRFIRF